MLGQGLGTSIRDLRKRGHSYTEITQILNCTRSTVSRHCKAAGLSSQVNYTSSDIASWQALYDQGNSLRKVSAITRKSVETLRRYLVTRPKVYLNTKQLRKRRSVAVQRRRRKLKELLVEYKGGKCERCGYCKSVWALEFHHHDPSTKRFNLSSQTRSLVDLKEEVDKCMLVCANCHREVEHELYTN